MEVEVLLFLHDLALTRNCLILSEQALRLIVDEVAEDLKRVFLLNLLTLKELSNLSESLPILLPLSHLILLLFLKLLDSETRLLSVMMTFLKLSLKVLCHFHEIGPFLY